MRFCPAATIKTSALTRLKVLRQKRLITCHILASAKRGSIHTLRFLMAFRYGSISA